MSYKIIGSGMYVPERVVTNDELSGMMDTNDEWIRQRVGVEVRHISTGQPTDELGYHAARSAIENSGVDPSTIDLILASSVSGEDVSPSVACMIQKRLGLKCMAFEVNAACSAFIFLLETAAAYFALGYRRILAVGAERLSRLVDWSDRSTAVIFGDGAGAMLLEVGDGRLASVFEVDGGDSVIKIPTSPGNSPFFVREGDAPTPYIKMNGQDTFKFAVNSMCRDIKSVLDKASLTLDDVACIIPHQANARIIAFAAKMLGLPTDKFYQNIARYGNTSSASIPIAFHEAVECGRIKRGDIVLMCGFGGGLASAATVVRY